MPAHILGLHHVTAITADAKANHDFYVNTLGLRLVKQTVNFDDPTSLHLYYGDEMGSPGSIVTFFAHTGLPRGVAGTPMVTTTMLGLLDYETEDGGELDEAADPDGMGLWLSPGEQRVRLEQVVHTLAADQIETSAAFIARFLGLAVQRFDDDRHFLAVPDEENNPIVQIEPASHAARPGAGTVHHVAFRIGSDEEQQALRAELVEAGVQVSPIMDRQYFKSIYFREPGGILLEVATDGPGFMVDEDRETLGTRLMLPAQFESRRAELEQTVPWIRQ